MKQLNTLQEKEKKTLETFLSPSIAFSAKYLVI